MLAWSGDAIPPNIVKSKDDSLHPVELQGAVVFQNKQCRNCHALEGIGGTRGPDLTTVGLRLTRDQLIDQVSNGTPGGGNMPAYGKQMSPAEMTALADFLVRLRPSGTTPAQTPTGNPKQVTHSVKTLRITMPQPKNKCAQHNVATGMRAAV